MTTTVRPDAPEVTAATGSSSPSNSSDQPTVVPSRKYWIDDWRPEDVDFWETTGAPIAKRNLIFSIISEHIGFSIWTMWSVLVLFLGSNYGFDPGQKFLLTTVPALVGSVLRIPYNLAVAKFGGRNWTIFTAAILLVPCAFTAAVLTPGVSFNVLLIAAALAGVGGGNFASSMSNINAFYPLRLKGKALGLNAGFGNLGVAGVQLVGLAVLATAGSSAPRLVIGFYVPLIVLATVLASLKMNSLTHVSNEKRAMRDVSKDPHTWIMSFLYIGTFGSFIGLAFAFGQVLQIDFKDTFDTPIKAMYLTFLGPLIGSLIRPIGGMLADRFGGARVTIINFGAMAIGGAVILLAAQSHSLPLYVAGFVVLFTLTGIGNGSTFKMIPAIFKAKATRAVAEGKLAQAQADHEARRLSTALIGIAGAIGAFGGVLVNLVLRQSFLTTKSGNGAYVAFVCFYLVCLAVTYVVYVRKGPKHLEGV